MKNNKKKKSIEYQGEKQIKAIQDNKKHLDNLHNKKQLGSNELFFHELFKINRNI